MRSYIFTTAFAFAALGAFAAEKGTSVFTDDFATDKTLAEHWNVEGDVKSEDGVLTLGKGGKVTWRGEVPEKYILEWKEGKDRRPMRRECTK